MYITVERITSNNDSTLSVIYVDGSFVCFGIEDEFRENKVPNETRIPAGIYDIGVRTVGGFNERYAAKFPDFHKGMLQVLNVPNFEYILIHIGNTDDDTSACLLVGQNAITSDGIRNSSSTNAYKKLYKKVINHALKGEAKIRYIDLDF